MSKSPHISCLYYNQRARGRRELSAAIWDAAHALCVPYYAASARDAGVPTRHTLLAGKMEEVPVGCVDLLPALPQLMRYYGEGLNGVHLPFNFQLVELSTWNAQTIKQVVESYEAVLPRGTRPNWCLANPSPAAHCQPRWPSRSPHRLDAPARHSRGTPPPVITVIACHAGRANSGPYDL